MKISVKLIGWIGSILFSFVLANLGLGAISENKFIGIIAILMAFGLLYFSYYTLQISVNTDEIAEIKERLDQEEEVLNTLKEIVILKKVGKIK